MSETTPTDSSTSIQEDFKIERLRYLQSQQLQLNSSTYKHLIFFQSTTTAIIIAAVIVFMSWKDLSISVETAQTAIHALKWLFVITACFVTLVVISTILSWWDCRVEECNLFNEIIPGETRTKPTLKTAWRWFETWLLVLVLLMVSGAFFFIEKFALPLIA